MRVCSKQCVDSSGQAGVLRSHVQAHHHTHGDEVVGVALADGRGHLGCAPDLLLNGPLQEAAIQQQVTGAAEVASAIGERNPNHLITSGDDAAVQHLRLVRLLKFYDSFAGFASLDDITEAALKALSRVQGSFAFVVYDSVAKRVWAARDAEGVQPLYWGVTEDARLVFGTDPLKLDGCTPTASPFPAGTLFASHDATLCHSPGSRGWVIRGEHPLPGQLLSFVASKVPTPRHRWRDVKAVPRMDEEGHICGAVYRVSSEPQMEKVGSH